MVVQPEGRQRERDDRQPHPRAVCWFCSCFFEYTNGNVCPIGTEGNELERNGHAIFGVGVEGDKLVTAEGEMIDGLERVLVDDISSHPTVTADIDCNGGDASELVPDLRFDEATRFVT